MRDATKVIIGFGSIWGLFAFGAMLFGSFTLGANDSTPETIVIILYGLTILPSSILAIWFKKYAAVWLIALFPMTAFGLIYQVVKEAAHDQTRELLIGSILTVLIIAVIPGLLGWLLLRSGSDSEGNAK